MEKVVKVDKFGRVLIPKKIRDRYAINENSNFVLSVTKNGFILKLNNEYEDMISKIKLLERNCDFSFVLTDNKKILYSSKKYEDWCGESISFINGENIKKCGIDNYVFKEIDITLGKKGFLYVIYKDPNSKKLAKLVCLFFMGIKNIK